MEPPNFHLYRYSHSLNGHYTVIVKMVNSILSGHLIAVLLAIHVLTSQFIGSGTFRLGTGHLGAGTIGLMNFFFQIRFSVATLFRFAAHFAHVRIEDPSRSRFALNGIQGITCFIVFS